MKQYFVTNAYTDNYKVVKVNNGKVEGYDIVAYYELGGYMSALESFGYKKAEYVPDYERKVQEAKKAYEEALEWLEDAKKNALQLCDKDAVEFFPKCFSESEIERYSHSFFLG